MAAVNTAYPEQSMENRVGENRHSNSNGHVGFRMPTNNVQYNQEREKYLTAKYPKRQMSLIRKRIAVEHWLDDELKKLYGVSQDDLYPCEIDLDELLDIDEDSERKAEIQQFIEALLEKANTL